MYRRQLADERALKLERFAGVKNQYSRGVHVGPWVEEDEWQRDRPVPKGGAPGDSGNLRNKSRLFDTVAPIDASIVKPQRPVAQRRTNMAGWEEGEPGRASRGKGNAKNQSSLTFGDAKPAFRASSSAATAAFQPTSRSGAPDAKMYMDPPPRFQRTKSTVFDQYKGEKSRWATSAGAAQSAFQPTDRPAAAPSSMGDTPGTPSARVSSGRSDAAWSAPLTAENLRRLEAAERRPTPRPAPGMTAAADSRVQRHIRDQQRMSRDERQAAAQRFRTMAVDDRSGERRQKILATSMADSRGRSHRHTYGDW